MSQTYFAILTAIGEAKLANATALGTTLQLTQMGVGDGNGSTPLPNRNQTTLLRENRRAPLNRLFVDPANASQIIAEQVIPEEIGGWWIREIGLYDADGNLCAVANCPDTYKPVLAEGSGRTQVIRMVLIVSNTSAVQLKIDPAIVLATRGYVDDEFGKHLAALDPHPVYLTSAEGDAKIAAALISPVLSGDPPPGWAELDNNCGALSRQVWQSQSRAHQAARPKDRTGHPSRALIHRTLHPTNPALVRGFLFLETAMNTPMTPTTRDGWVSMPLDEFERLIEDAAERGAKRAMTDVGLDGESAAADIRELRGLLEAFNTAKHTA